LLELFSNILSNWLTEIKQLKFVVFLENLVLTQLIKKYPISMKPDRRLLYFSHRISVPALSAYNSIYTLTMFVSMVCFNSRYTSLRCVFGLAFVSTILSSKHFKLISHLLSDT
jgi:hypothetical protein